MKKTVNKKQFENLIAECIQEVISESRQIKPKKPTRKVMNEAQLQHYIQNIINEELENEGMFNQIKQGVKGAAAGMFGKGRGGGLVDRFKAAKDNATKNYQAQGQIDTKQEVFDYLTNLVNQGKVKPETTVYQLVGKGKNGYNQINHFQSSMSNLQRGIFNRNNF